MSDLQRRFDKFKKKELRCEAFDFNLSGERPAAQVHCLEGLSLLSWLSSPELRGSKMRQQL